MGKFHDQLEESGYEGHPLGVFLVRLLFCLFADDTGIFEKDTFKDFFENASLNPNAHLITGIIRGYRVEEITNKITRENRYLHKLEDELAKGTTL